MIDTAPFDYMAEQAVLGAILIDGSVSMPVALELLKPNSFKGEHHKEIYTSMISMFNNSDPIDIVTVAARLKNDKVIDEEGMMGKDIGYYYLTELSEAVPFPLNMLHYAEIVAKMYMKREGFSILQKSAEEIYDVTRNPKEVVASAANKLADLQTLNIRSEFKTGSDLMLENSEYLDMVKKQDGCLTGVTSGFHVLDECTNGFQDTDLIYLGGRPGMGKTTMALNMMWSAIKRDVPVAFISLEMKHRQLSLKLVALVARVSYEDLRRGRLSDSDWKKVSDAQLKISQSPVYCDDLGGRTITDIFSKVSKLKREKNIGFLVVDYIQLMSLEIDDKSIYETTTKISKRFKEMAKDLDIPVLVLTQLSRAAESTPGGKPKLYHLKESGGLEQDADCVILLYRKGYYQAMNGEDVTDTTTEIILAKNRNGRMGTALAEFIPDQSRFYELDKRPPAPVKGVEPDPKVLNGNAPQKDNELPF